MIIHFIILFTIFPITSAKNPPTQPPLVGITPYIAGDFGTSISLSDNFILIGAPVASVPFCPSCGMASIWQYDSLNLKWNLVANLESLSVTTSNGLGTSVALAMPYAIAGAPYHANTYYQDGAVVIFTQNPTNISDWSNSQLFINPDLTYDGIFGSAVAVSSSPSSSWGVVGASYNTNMFTNDGSVYLYQQKGTSWSYKNKLVASDPHAGDNFGCSVAIDNDYILVGAMAGDLSVSVISTGTAYLFQRDMSNSWNFMSRVTSASLITGDHFGVSVSISDNFVFIGATNALNIGAIYIFKLDRGQGIANQFSVISNPHNQFGDLYGSSISVKKSIAIVGSHNAYSQRGFSQIFQYDGTKWNSLYLINDTTPMSSGDHFGYSTAVSENLIAMASPYKNSNNGMVYSLQITSLKSNIWLIIIIIIIIISTGLLSGVGATILILKYRKSKSSSKLFNIPTIPITSNTKNMKNSDMKSNSTQSTANSTYSQVKRISLGVNMSIKSADLDLYNPKVVKNV